MIKEFFDGLSCPARGNKDALQEILDAERRMMKRKQDAQVSQNTGSRSQDSVKILP